MMNDLTSIPFSGIDKIFKNHSEEILSTVSKIYSGGRLMMGPEVEEFEQEISKLCNRKYAVAVANCTDALYFSLLSAGIKKGDEVLVTGFSFIASVTPILRVGAIPVFVDINSESFMMNLDDLKKKITPSTKGIVAVHLFGQMLPMNELNEIAQANKLILVEDAAQALGSQQEGQPAGSMGLASCFSFDPTKIVGAFGTGGVILTDDEEVFNSAKRLRYHGKNMKTGEFEVLGYNSRLPTLQAALINLQLRWLPKWISERNNIAQAYNTELSSIDHISIPRTVNKNDHTYHKYVIKIKNRAAVVSGLQENGIQTQVHYERAVFEHPLFNEFTCKTANLAMVHELKNQVLSLPIYPGLESKEVQQICTVLKEQTQSI